MKDLSWESIINKRRSTRSFETRGLDANTMEAVEPRWGYGKDIVEGRRIIAVSLKEINGCAVWKLSLK